MSPRALSSVATAALLIGLAYIVLIGGTVIGELDPVLWLIGAMVGGGCVAYVMSAPQTADRVDRHVLLAVVLFLTAALLSNTPRQSFDAALLVLAYSAALFVGRSLMAPTRARHHLLITLVALSAVLTLLAAARWIPQYVEWWLLTGRSVIPPLSLGFIAVPWGHRYDLMTAILLLYPAWWTGSPGTLRRALGTVIGALVMIMLVITGSRALWLAVGAASIALAVPHAIRAWRVSQRFRLGVGIGAPFGGLLLFFSGALPLLVARATSLETLSFRSAMWGRLTEVWAAHPLAGFGPGSMPWILQQTDYFDSNSWAPRHPDSVPVQLLAEVGLLGIAAVGILLISVGPAILRGSSPGARWAITVFVLASVLMSPTELPFIMAIVVAWVAFALPTHTIASIQKSKASLAMRYASASAIGVIGVAYLATFAAAASYDRGRSMIDENRLDEAGNALDYAVTLDPGLAIYARQRGTIAYLEGDAESAIRDLRRATELNASDDLAWRTLGLAYESADQPDAAGEALTQALDRQRTDLTNVLLYARWLDQQDRVAEASALLIEVVQSTPAIIAAPGWAELLPSELSTDEILAAAAERWAIVPHDQLLPVDPPLWLGVLTGRDDLISRVLDQPGVNAPMAQATVALLRCEAADDLLALADDDAIRGQDYWSLRLWADANAGRATDLPWRVLAIMRGDFDTISGAVGPMNPLDENGATSADVWGYRRYPIHWPDAPFGLPSPAAGLRHWLTDSEGAVRDAGMQDQLPGCA